MHYFRNPAHIYIYDFDRVFLEIPVKNCIVGMLVTCPIFTECHLFVVSRPQILNCTATHEAVLFSNLLYIVING